MGIKRKIVLKQIYSQKPIIVILGPTASGKSDLAVELARRFNGEVVSADSRQVYKGMDISAGKITKKEMKGVPHYLLDVASPKRIFTAAQYQKLARAAIKKIWQEDKLPIICGGTGHYIQMVIDNLQIPKVQPDWQLRQKLEKQSAEKLYQWLEKLDPRRAKNIDRFNRRRLIRAIEIVKISGRPVPPFQIKPQKNVLILGVKKPLPEIKKLIAKRLKKRLRHGMIKEVKKLRFENKISWEKIESFGLGYRWISLYFKNGIAKKKLFEKICQAEKNYAQRQMTWFRRDKRIKWIKNFKEAEKVIKQFYLRAIN